MMQADSRWTSCGVRMTWSVSSSSIKHTPSLWAEPRPLCDSFALQGATSPQNLQYFPSLLVSTTYQRLSFSPPGFAYSSFASLLWFGSRSPPPPTCIHQKKKKKKRLPIPICLSLKIDCSEFPLAGDACACSNVFFWYRCKWSATPVKSVWLNVKDNRSPPAGNMIYNFTIVPVFQGSHKTDWLVKLSCC